MQKLIEPYLKEIGQVIATEASKASRKNLPDIIFISLTIVFMLLAIIGFMIALYMYLSTIFLDRYAMMAVTFMLLVLAGLSFAIVKKTVFSEEFAKSNRKTEALNQKKSQPTDIATTMGVEISKLIGKYPKNASLIAMALGVSMGISPELRQVLLDQLNQPNKD